MGTVYLGGSKDFDGTTATRGRKESVDPTPILPESQPYDPNKSSGIKAATPDIIIFDEKNNSVDGLASLIFENLGAQELINLVRSDTIDGKNVDYSPISNLKLLDSQYNSKNIISVPGGLDQFFKNFAIRLDIHLPEVGTGPGGTTVYIDKNNPNDQQRNRLVVDVTNMKTNEQVEIQVLNAGSYLPAIINSTEDL